MFRGKYTGENEMSGLELMRELMGLDLWPFPILSLFVLQLLINSKSIEPLQQKKWQNTRCR